MPRSRSQEGPGVVRALVGFCLPAFMLALNTINLTSTGWQYKYGVKRRYKYGTV